MRKILTLALFAMLLSSCALPQDENEKTAIMANGEQFYEDFTVVVIDSCEYVISTSIGNRGYMAHKGDCKYCAKKRMEEMRKVLREEGLSNKLW